MLWRWTLQIKSSVLHYTEKTQRITEKLNDSPHTPQILAAAENKYTLVKIIHWHCITQIPLFNLYLHVGCLVSFSLLHFQLPHTSETFVSVIKRTEYCENIKTETAIDGSWHYNHVRWFWAYYQGNVYRIIRSWLKKRSTEEIRSWLRRNRKSQKTAKVPGAQPTASAAVTP